MSSAGGFLRLVLCGTLLLWAAATQEAYAQLPAVLYGGDGPVVHSLIDSFPEQRFFVGARWRFSADGTFRFMPAVADYHSDLFPIDGTYLQHGDRIEIHGERRGEGESWSSVDGFLSRAAAGFQLEAMVHIRSIGARDLLQLSQRLGTEEIPFTKRREGAVEIPGFYRVALQGTVNGQPFTGVEATLGLLEAYPGDVNPVHFTFSSSSFEAVGSINWQSFIRDRWGYGMRTTAGRWQGTTLVLETLPGQPSTHYPSWVTPVGSGLLAGISTFAVTTRGKAELAFAGDRLSGTIDLEGLTILNGRPMVYHGVLAGEAIDRRPLAEGMLASSTTAVDRVSAPALEGGWELFAGLAPQAASVGHLALRHDGTRWSGLYRGTRSGHLAGAIREGALSFTFQDDADGPGQGFLRPVSVSDSSSLLAGLWLLDGAVEPAWSVVARGVAGVAGRPQGPTDSSSLGLRAAGEELLATERYREAIGLLERARQAARAEVEAHQMRRGEIPAFEIASWGEQTRILEPLIRARFQAGDFEQVVDLMAEQVEIDERLYQISPSLRRSSGPALAEQDSRVQTIESWRAGLDTDQARIDALNQSQKFFERYLQFLTTQQQEREALVVSELARARAFADLMTARSGERTPFVRPGTAAPLTLRDLSRIVKEHGSTTVEYFLLADELRIWVVNPAGEVSSHRAPIGRQKLEQKLDEVQSLLTRIHYDEQELARLQELLRELDRWLIEPIPRARLPESGSALTLIPHGPLFELPFAALRDAEGRLLIERWPLAFASSIAVLGLGRDQSHAGERSLLALFDPPYPEGFTPLPFAAENHERITGLYPATRRILLREAATETAFKEAAPHYDVLYLSTHGFAKMSQFGLDSAVLLAPNPLADDGYLRPEEISLLQLNADLVLLSACQTGRGEVSSDGVFGLARAFLSAGARSAMVSLWEIPEIYTFAQLHHFHTHWLKEGLPRAQALQRAQIEMAKMYPQPQIWAGMILIGDWKE